MIGLSHNLDTWRVQLAISDRPDGTVLVERSTNELFWQTVRGGVALPLEVGGSLSDWEYRDKKLNHYRVVPVDPPAGLLVDGTAGSYASTPDVAALDITGDLDVRVHARLDDWTATGTQTLAAKYTRSGNQRSWLLAVLPSGAPQLIWSANGTAFTTDSSTIPLTPDPETGELAVRVNVNADFGGGNRQITFRTAPSLEGPWALHEHLTVAGVVALFNSTAPLTVGADEVGTLNLAAGSIIAAEVRDGIDGTVVANPDFAAQPHGTTGFTDAAGRVWTVNGTAQIVGIEQASITPDNGGIIVLKVIRHPFLNQPVTVTDFSDIEADGRGGLVEVEGRSVPVDMSDLMTSDGFTLELQTNTPTAERNLMLAIRAGEQMLLQTPPGCPVPGGYIRTEALRRSRRLRSARSARRYFTLPCRVIAQPGPDIIGGTMTMRALADLYGSFDGLRAAHTEFAELVDLMADPDALVVL